MARNLVFVYGTLKRNQPNHNWLTKKENGNGEFLGLANTKELYPLVIASRYNIPYVLNHPGKGKQIEGEIYEVDDKMLSKLDILEDHPDYYERKIRKAIMQSTKEEKECWIYLMDNCKKHILELPFLYSYSSTGDHGLPYQTRELREVTGPEYWADVKNIS